MKNSNVVMCKFSDVVDLFDGSLSKVGVFFDKQFSQVTRMVKSDTCFDQNGKLYIASQASIDTEKLLSLGFNFNIDSSLKAYIASRYDGNITVAASHMGYARQVLNRMVNEDTQFIDGKVYRVVKRR